MPLPFPPPLETARLRVRAVRDNDLADLLAVNGDPEVTRYLPYAAWTGPADAQAWLARMRGIEAQGGAVQLVAEQRASERAIGTLLLFRHDEERGQAELGYALGRAWWGGGWMSEALAALLDWTFRDLGLERLAANVSAPNAASQRLLLRLGFRRAAAPEVEGAPPLVGFEMLARDWIARPLAASARSR